MNLHKPFVYFPNLLTDRQCDDIIKLGTTKLQSATTVDGRDKTNKEKSIAVSDMTNEEIEKKGLTTLPFPAPSTSWKNAFLFSSCLPKNIDPFEDVTFVVMADNILPLKFRSGFVFLPVAPLNSL